MKTEALKQALDKYGCDAAIGGARRDEEKSRAKERVFSFRDAQHRWDPKNQRPELWNLYNGRLRRGDSIRVFPLSNWTEVDIWTYIHTENIPVVPLYFAKPRPVVDRDGLKIMVDDDRLPLNPGEKPHLETIRFRSLGLLSAAPGAQVSRPRASRRSSKRCCAPRPRSARAAPSTPSPRRRWRIASVKVISEWPPFPSNRAASNRRTSPRTLDQFLAQQRDIDLLRFITCGSRRRRQEHADRPPAARHAPGVRRPARGAWRTTAAAGARTGEVPDLALLVDGLQAEREQGITIDVAYRYFSTPKRKFIVADCPGHEQYTRNMATGASTADAGRGAGGRARRACACRRAATRTSSRCWACRT